MIHDNMKHIHVCMVLLLQQPNNFWKIHLMLSIQDVNALTQLYSLLRLQQTIVPLVDWFSPINQSINPSVSLIKHQLCAS